MARRGLLAKVRRTCVLCVDWTTVQCKFIKIQLRKLFITVRCIASERGEAQNGSSLGCCVVLSMVFVQYAQ